MKRTGLLTILIFIFIGACSSLDSPDNASKNSTLESPTKILTTEVAEIQEPFSSEATIAKPTPSPTPTPDPFSDLYGCEMELKFISGPLESRETQFTVLGKDYFHEKGNKFDPGKGTSIYYEEQHYFILHSSYVNGNILKPMEAEFIRFYLENWGDAGPDYIQRQIDNLIGTEVVWTCSGSQVFRTRINGITRLSHEASNRLWIEPRYLAQILKDREGLVSEWVGEFDDTDKPTIYIGFCGWGESSLGDIRFAYFRYLIHFEIIQSFRKN